MLQLNGVGEKDFETSWNTCERGDWLLWLAYKLKIDLKILTLAKAKCAETAIHLMQDERSINAVKVAIKYGEGNATLEELKTAAAFAAAAAATDTADVAAYATDTADVAAYAAYAAAAAATAAAAADAVAATAYTAAARKDSLKVSADICRKYISIEMIKEKYEDF